HGDSSRWSVITPRGLDGLPRRARASRPSSNAERRRHRGQLRDRVDVAARGAREQRQLQLRAALAVGIVDEDLAPEEPHLLAARPPGATTASSASRGAGASRNATITRLGGCRGKGLRRSTSAISAALRTITPHGLPRCAASAFSSAALTLASPSFDANTTLPL